MYQKKEKEQEENNKKFQTFTWLMEFSESEEDAWEKRKDSREKSRYLVDNLISSRISAWANNVTDKA